MMDAVRAARERHRKAVERLYEGKATVTEHQKVIDPETKLTNFHDVIVLRGQPCRLSFEKIQAAGHGEPAVGTAQLIRLFLPPDVVIRPGSKITVEQNGTIADYTYSGKPAVLTTHQEIILELFERWA